MKRLLKDHGWIDGKARNAPPIVDALLRLLFPHEPSRNPNVYAVLDGARDERVQPLVAQSGQAQQCLYLGQLEPPMVRVAPYVVQLTPDANITRTLLAHGWGNSWGIFVRTTASLVDLRQHLRRFLRVSDERGRILLFRYYDPRVLRVYLPTCTPDEIEQFFGPIACYVVESEEPMSAITFEREAGRLSTSTQVLVPPPAASELVGQR